MDNTLVGRTETMKNNLNPSFNTPIKIQYYFEKIQKLTISIVDVDNDEKKTGESLGQITTTLGDIVSQDPGTPYTRSIEDGKGTILITFEEIIPIERKTFTSDFIASTNSLVTQEMKKGSTHTVTIEEFIIDAKGIKLEKMDRFGKSDPYYYIYRVFGDKKLLIYKSEVIKNNLNPVWKTADIRLENLDGNCLAQGQKYWIEVYDHDKVGSDDLIGGVEFEDLFYNITPEGREYKEILKDKTGKGKHKDNRGEIILNIKYDRKTINETLNSYKVISNYNFATNLKTYPNLLSPISFIDAMRMGMKLHIICAVDYTSSNGSMHDINENEMNPYQTALSAVGQVLEPYDHDRRFSFFGYGAYKNDVFPPYFTVGETEEIDGGVQGILDTYTKTRDQFRLGDMGSARGGDMNWRANNGKYFCDDFYQIINAVSDKAEADMMIKFPPNSHILPLDYYIIFFVIDGDGFDMDGTIRALIRASSLPISIVLIGVGGSNFDNLSKFDADGTPLSVDGVSTVRDIVQFVKFDECKENNVINMTKLASEVLAEVPTQVETFIGLYGCTIPNNAGYPMQNY
ncbi:Copine-domain-containing protein [Anaeromyces robustus]|uniref:Copine-domain-containing protein n=1 Tax=Anaeromyces robustus TaxID=1754192 RepID=A0A1Y1XP73_9FUNG|nr:Copine-domain-containing protein [Anaeromyces robustus]|eukprot:ORX87316.1 Copine-domain-containing protein [Anaeromyces robustus]